MPLYLPVFGKAGTSDGIQALLSLSRQASDSGVLSKLGDLFQSGGSSFSGLLGMAGSLFGDKLGNIGKLIANFSGIKESSAASLLSMVTPAALGKLGSHVFANNLSVKDVSSLLTDQKQNILSAIPSDFNLAGAFGVGNLSAIGAKLSALASGASSHHTHDSHVTQEETRKSSPLIPAFWAIGIFVALLYIFKSCGVDNTPHTAHTATQEKEHTEILPAEPVRESLKVKLPDGVELDAYKGGIEDNLVTYLNSTEPVSKEKWFDFDDLNFETGSAVITAASMKQVQNIAAILKAFPKVKIKIGVILIIPAIPV